MVRSVPSCSRGGRRAAGVASCRRRRVRRAHHVGRVAGRLRQRRAALSSRCAQHATRGQSAVLTRTLSCPLLSSPLDEAIE